MRRGILTSENDGDLMIDVRRNTDGMIVSGVVVGDSDEQHIEHNIISNRGEIKEYPHVGGEIVKWKNGMMTELLLRKMQQSLGFDGYTMDDVKFLINN